MDYDRKFHGNIARTSSPSAKEIVPNVLELIGPQSVIDVGCGTGAWLAEFARKGVPRIVGLDDHVESDQLLVPADQFRRVDLSRPFEMEHEFDLVVSLEVAEHLPAGAARGFIKSLVKLGPVVLFSAAIPHQGGTGHVNEQWPDYWAELFRENAFFPVDCLRTAFWTNPQVAWWYAQNMVLYVRADQFQRFPTLSWTHASPLRLVHPANYLAHADSRELGIHAAVSILWGAGGRAIARRLRSLTTRLAQTRSKE